MLAALLDFITGGQALIWIGGAVTALLALLGYGRAKKRQGAVESAAKGKEEDSDNAQDIRRRVSDDRADRVRTLDDAGYRD